MLEYAIEVRNLHYAYPNGYVALRGINLKIRRGEKIAIMGNNGAGKTTLIKHFNGLLKPTKGDVFVFGLNTKEHSVAELSKKVGLVFQNPYHQFFSERVWDEIAFALRNFNFPEDVIRRRVEKVLKIFHLEEYVDRSPFGLSGGEMRRLAIASVLVYDPEIIVLDEPTVGQDRIQKESIAEIIKMLELQGKTIVVVTHDIEFVAENFNRVVVMSGGRIIADGKAKDVLYDKDVLVKAGLVRPIIAEFTNELARANVVNGGFKALTVYELYDYLLKMVRGSNP